MFTKKDPPEVIALKEVISNLMSEMHGYEGKDEDYAKMVAQLKIMFELLTPYESKRPSPDTLVIVTGNLIIALLVVGYEHANIVTSKVWTFVQKLQ